VTGQNSVLKLSHAHMRILINRQFLLSNFSTLGQVDKPDDDGLEHQKYVRDCVSAAYVIIDTGTSYSTLQPLYYP
jgi:hypothetical protein